MNRHPEIEELQDYAEELLPPRRHEEIRAHVQECPACRRELEAIRELLEGLAGLPTEAEPSRDLWPQIGWRIGAQEAPTGARGRRRTVTLPVWQLLAASVALAILSGGVVWSVLNGTAQGPSAVATAPAEETEGTLYAVEYAAYDEYSDAILELESVVEAGRDVLDPETIRVLEENMAIIDQAILESTEALADDPGSKTLRRILSETMRRKVDLLQRTAEFIVANT
jgi:hypothetical protein